MKNLNTGIELFDQIVNDLPLYKIYSIRSNANNISYFFLIQMIINLLKHNEKVLFLTSAYPKDVINDFNYFEYNVKASIENQNLILVEQPKELDLILSNLHNLDSVFDDLSSYIQFFNVSFVFVDSLKSFFPKNNISSSKIIINRLIKLFENHEVTCFIDSSNIEYDLEIFIEKQIYGLFSFKYNSNNVIHQLNYRICSSGQHTNVSFSIDSFRYFVSPKLKIKKLHMINDIDTVFLHDNLLYLKEFIQNNLTKNTHIIPFSDVNDIREKMIVASNFILFLHDNYMNNTGLKTAVSLKQKIDLCKVVLIINNNMTPNHKVRMLRMGIDAILENIPNADDVNNLFLKLFPILVDNENEYNMMLLSKNKINFLQEINQSIYFDVVNRTIRDYIFDNIHKVNSFQFIKISIDDQDSFSFIQSLKQYQGLLAVIQNQINEKEKHLIAIFEDMKEKTVLQLIHQIKLLINNNIKINNDNTNILKSLFLNEESRRRNNDNIIEKSNKITSFNYPFNEVDFDLLMKKVFEHVH